MTILRKDNRCKLDNGECVAPPPEPAPAPSEEEEEQDGAEGR
jgi:hypothetical protein